MSWVYTGYIKGIYRIYNFKYVLLGAPFDRGNPFNTIAEALSMITCEFNMFQSGGEVCKSRVIQSHGGGVHLSLNFEFESAFIFPF